jgi:tRNA (adenine37-N6)-methyltransferase
MDTAIHQDYLSEPETTMNRLAFALVAIATVTAAHAAESDSKPEAVPGEFTMRPIGHVKKSDDRTWIVLDKQYQPGLLGLEGFSHIHVIWWFDKNDTPRKRSILQVHPRGDRSNPLTGVFACRAPVRPNLLALSLCKVLAVNENLVEIDGMDAFDGTPVLDIKPFAPGIDSASDVRVPEWTGPR